VCLSREEHGMGSHRSDTAALGQPGAIQARRIGAADPQSARVPSRPVGPLASSTKAADAVSPMVQAAARGRAGGRPGSPAGSFLLAVQRRYGNLVVQRLLQPLGGRGPAGPVPVLQPKLTLGLPGDRYERQADLVARRVAGGWPGRDSGGQDAGRSGGVEGTASAGLEASVTRASGRGEPLAGPVVAPMEEAFGVDFGRVRVHRDVASDELCRSISARAFTLGDHIFFRRGEDAGAPAGRHLLAHELAHVVQQRGQAVRAGAAPGPAEGGLAPRDTIQRFWVLENGQYRWKSDQTKKQRYVKTSHRRHTFWHPAEHRVYIDPWEQATPLGPTHLRVDPDAAIAAALKTKVVTDLKKIRKTAVGAKLLRKLAKVQWNTMISPASKPVSPETHSGDQASRVKIHPDELNAVALLEQANRALSRTETATWNPIPSDVVLFHELVHAYHSAYNSKVNGEVAKDQAIHRGDVGVPLTEYQTVGLDTLDGKHAWSQDLFTENQYRLQRQPHLPRRTAYNLLMREYDEASRSSLAGSRSGENFPL
jgi:hypothetical protein